MASARSALAPCPAGRRRTVTIAGSSNFPVGIERGFTFDIPRVGAGPRALPGMNPPGAVQGLHDAPNGPAGLRRRRRGPRRGRVATPSERLPKNHTPFHPRPRTQEPSKNSSSKPDNDADDPAPCPWVSFKRRGSLGGKVPPGVFTPFQGRVSRASSGPHNARKPKQRSRWIASPQPCERVRIPRGDSGKG